MQLAWQTDSESKLDIKAAMMGLREVQCSKQLALPVNVPAGMYLAGAAHASGHASCLSRLSHSPGQGL